MFSPLFQIRCRRGFTLIELLAAIAILAILVLLLVSGAGSIRTMMNRSVCMENLRNIGLAHAQYSADHDGWFTPNRWDNAARRKAIFWNHQLAAYLRGEKEPSGAPDPPVVCKVFHCPEAKEPLATSEIGYASDYVEKSSYSQNIALGGGKQTAVAYPPMQKRTSVQKPSRMVLVVEGGAVNAASWSYESATSFKGRHGSQRNFLFVDGHVESSTYPSTPERGNKSFNWNIDNELN